jgi:signal transduction histidine kinase
MPGRNSSRAQTRAANLPRPFDATPVQQSQAISAASPNNSVVSPLQLKSLLNVILAQFRRLIKCDALIVFAVENGKIHFYQQENIAPHAKIPPDLWENIGGLNLVENVLKQDEPVVASDLSQNDGWQKLVADWGDILHDTNLTAARSFMGVPLRADEQVVGIVLLLHNQPDFFTARYSWLAQTMSTQAMSAYDRLYERAQENAVAGERARLARELHDTITQIFYSVVLAANIGQATLHADPQQTSNQLHEIMLLAEAGLTEMRTLLMELHPESLYNEGLTGSLKKRLAILEMRYGLQVEHNLNRGEPDLPAGIKETLFKIAQEALNNVVKHAGAYNLSVKLERQPGIVCLEITDDGRGFAPNSDYAGHLGLVSMRERAAQWGGKVEIESSPVRSGVRVFVTLPLK